MFKSLRWIAFIISMLVLSAMACSFNFSTAKINNARLATDEDGNNKQTTFTVGDTIYAVMDLDNAPSDTKVEATWYAVEAEGIEPNTKINEEPVSIETGSGDVWFSLDTAAVGVTAGKYKVEISLNGKKDKTLEFTIE